MRVRRQNRLPVNETVNETQLKIKKVSGAGAGDIYFSEQSLNEGSARPWQTATIGAISSRSNILCWCCWAFMNIISCGPKPPETSGTVNNRTVVGWAPANQPCVHVSTLRLPLGTSLLRLFAPK